MVLSEEEEEEEEEEEGEDWVGERQQPRGGDGVVQ
jgi:hypothetical protein